MRQLATKLLPLLVLYLVVIVSAGGDFLQGDGSRYVGFADNLLRGYYSPPGQIHLANGPGYPMFLLPFVALGLPLIVAALANALLLYGALLYMVATLARILPARALLPVAYAIGLYPPFAKYLPFLLTESLAICLVSGFVYHFSTALREESDDHFLSRNGGLAAAMLTMLALTKVIFGFVVTLMLAGLLVWYLKSKRSQWVRPIRIFAITLLACLPYLTYTYSVTGKVFYWSTYAGASLYWMSALHDDELGDWQGNRLEQLQDRGEPGLVARHGEFLERVSAMNELDRDFAFKAAAVDNILQRPEKFVRNWVANVGRLLFNFPYSYSDQRLTKFLILLPNMVLVTLLLGSLYPLVKCWGQIPLALRILLMFATIEFALSSVASAYNRQFTPIVPILLVWICFAGSKLIHIRLERD